MINEEQLEAFRQLEDSEGHKIGDKLEQDNDDDDDDDNNDDENNDENLVFQWTTSAQCRARLVAKSRWSTPSWQRMGPGETMMMMIVMLIMVIMVMLMIEAGQHQAGREWGRVGQ